MIGMMKKAGLAMAMAATAVTGMTVSTAADAQRFHGGGGFHGGGFHGGGYRGGYGGYHRGGIGAGGAAVLGGLVGLGVGAAIASNHGPYYGGGYGGGYYGRPYYGGGYYAGGYYGPHCWRQWRWDPYWGRNVPVRVCD